MLDGKRMPFAEVEIEFYNKEEKAEAPNEYMVTQVVKTDRNGVFTYAVPKAGWWGFAALTTADLQAQKGRQGQGGRDRRGDLGVFPRLADAEIGGDHGKHAGRYCSRWSFL